MQSARDLGVILDPNLTFDNHILTTSVSGCIARLAQINRVKHCFTCLTLQQNVLLFDCLGKYHKWNCYKTWCCRPFKRIVSGAKKYDHVTPLLKSLSWLLVKDQLYYHQAIMAFKCKTSQAPEYLTSQYITREQVSELTTRSSLKLNVPLLRTAFGQRTFLLQDC